MSPRFLIVTLAGLLALGVSAFADGQGKDSQSKENKKFEAQTQADLSFLNTWNIFKDGIVTFGYAAQDSGNTDQSSRYDFKLETRFAATNESRDGSRVLWIPMEIRIRGTGAQDQALSAIRDYRVGILRYVDPSTGFTIQGPGFKQVTDDNARITYQAIQLGEITFNSFTPLNSDGTDLVLKATVSLDFPTRISAIGDNQQALYQSLNTLAPRSHDQASIFHFGASAGLRFASGFMADLYGSQETRASFEDRTGSKDEGTYVQSDLGFQHTTFGVGVRYPLQKWLYVRGWSQSTRYSMDQSATNQVLGLDAGQSKVLQNRYTGIGLEFRW